MSDRARHGESCDARRAFCAMSSSSRRAFDWTAGSCFVSVIRRENAWRISEAGLAAAEAGTAAAAAIGSEGRCPCPYLPPCSNLSPGRYTAYGNPMASDTPAQGFSRKHLADALEE